MTADEIRALYRDMCQMDVTVRRYAGAPGSRTKTDYVVKGYYRQYGGKDLIGTIAQGDQQVIVLADDLTTAGFSQPMTTADRVLAGATREKQIMSIGERRAPDSTLIALELQARG